MATTGPITTRVVPLTRAMLAKGPDWRPAPGIGRHRLPVLVRAIGPRVLVSRDYGRGYIRDTVKRKGTPANVPLRRLVRCIRESDGTVVRVTWSDATTGAYAFEQLPTDERYTVIAYDYEHGYGAAIADNLPASVDP